MTEITWILDETTGQLLVEGLTSEEAPPLVGDLLPPASEVYCAAPMEVLPLIELRVLGGEHLPPDLPREVADAVGELDRRIADVSQLPRDTHSR